MTKEVKSIWEVFGSKLYFLDNIKIGLMPKQETDLITRDSWYEGCMMFMFAKVKDRDGIVRLKESHLEKLGIDIEDAWCVAISNMIDDCQIKTFESMILGMDVDPDDATMFIVTTSDGYLGAGAAVAWHKVYNYFKENTTKDKWVILPSSVHEMIVAPVPEGMDKDDFVEMVRSVNETEVAPKDRLADNAWFFEINPCCQKGTQKL